MNNQTVPARSEQAPSPKPIDSVEPPLVAAIHNVTQQNGLLIADPSSAIALINNGADINARSKADQDTPLIAASKRGYLEVVQLLISKGADVNATDAWRQSALKWASTLGFTEVVRALLSAGADPNLADQNGMTPLAGAQHPDHPPMPEIVKLLQDAGAK